jgi:hypothetical protein
VSETTTPPISEQRIRILEPEVLPPLALEISAETQLAALAERSLLDTLQKSENASLILAKRAELMSTARHLALRATRPEDWILTKDKQDIEIAMLSGPGADQVANLFGIQILNIRPLDERGIFQPEKIVDEKDPKRYTLRAWCDAFSRVTGRAVQSLEASRRSDEDFTGRSVDAGGAITFRGDGALDSDLRAAVQTLLRTKAVRVLGGMTRVPLSELKAAGLDTAKCRRGHGYGSGDNRRAQDGAEADVVQQAEALWKDILRRVGGDESAANQVLKEITAYPAHKEGKYKAFDGCKSWQEINTQKRVETARSKLAKHSQFGDQAERDPGEE